MSGHRSGATRRHILGLLGGLPLAVGAANAAGGVTPGRHQPARLAAATGSRPDHGPAGSAGVTGCPADDQLATEIQKIIDRPEFQGGRWGIRLSWPAGGAPIYATNSHQPFVAASAAKVFIAATAFATLGPDYRFRTPVYRTGRLRDGVLTGDLVLVASGDLFLSSRVQPDGTIALPEPDHSYGTPDAQPIPGDPLVVIRELAAQVAAHGVRRVTGRVRVDASLFRHASQNIGVGATVVTVSPMMINDNIVDITVTPGSAAGAPAVLDVSPRTAYLSIVNEVTTVPDSLTARPLSLTADVTNPDGTHVATLTGEINQGTARLYHAYYIPDPVRFAEIAFTQVLRDAGVGIGTRLPATDDGTRRGAGGAVGLTPAGATAPARRYRTRDRLALHVSPPLWQEVKVMLKTSSNVHTVMYPYLVGAIAGHDPDNPTQAYDRFLAALFEQAGLTPPAG